MTPNAEVPAGLREWSSGGYAVEAGVELLVRSFGGRLAVPGWSWIATATSRAGRSWWIDVTGDADLGVLSGGERQVLAVVFALIADQPVVLSDLAGLDRDDLALVLAAIAHAAGSHEHSGYMRGVDGCCSLVLLSPLVAWPDTDHAGHVPDGRAA